MAEATTGGPAAGSTAERLLDSAEARLRRGGYNGFSFREIAADIGIRSASVHHHFPTKEALVARLAERYADRFIAALPACEGRALEAAYRDAFRGALAPQAAGGDAGDDAGAVAGAMCLCGLLGAEIAALPPAVRLAARRFFERAIAHLAERLDGPAETRHRRAVQVLGVLEGALIVAQALDDMAAFDATAAVLDAG